MRLVFLQHFPSVFPMSANQSVACFFVFQIRIQISFSSSKPYSTFPPIRFSFPLNSLTLTRLPSPPSAHIHLAHTPRYLICGLGSQIGCLVVQQPVFSVTESLGCRSFTTHASMRAGSQFPACFAHPSETWDGLTLGWGTFPTWKRVMQLPILIVALYCSDSEVLGCTDVCLKLGFSSEGWSKLRPHL